MMKTRSWIGVLGVLWCLGAVAGSAAYAAKVGEAAPEFSAQTFEGKPIQLSDYKGKFVVLEWHNQGCPFVKKHYQSGNMQKLQSEWTKKGVVWISVISSAPGKQGYVTAKEEKEFLKKTNAAPTEVIMDSNGKVGSLYGAKTTPHMFVINPQGVLIYNGAIDDHPGTDVEELKGAKNYVSAALEEAMAGKKVTVASTRPYGCSVKY